MNDVVRPDFLTRFSTATAKLAAAQRWDKHYTEIDNALILFASVGLGRQVTREEDEAYILWEPLMKASHVGNVSAAKLLLTQLGWTAPTAQPEVRVSIENKSLEFNVFNFKEPAAVERWIADLEAAGELQVVNSLREQIAEQPEYPITLRIAVPQQEEKNRV